MDVPHNLDKLAVFLAPIEAGDWHSVAEVRSKREDLVVNDQCTGQVNA